MTLIGGKVTGWLVANVTSKSPIGECLFVLCFIAYVVLHHVFLRVLHRS